MKRTHGNAATEFGYHAFTVGAIALLTLALDGGRPNDALPLGLLAIATTIRSVELQLDAPWQISCVLLDLAAGLSAADSIAAWG